MADYAIHDTTLEAIADTIRKKDGTVALIDPADYADRINLMGMLEEKTVSGNVVSFSDGADDVPLKKFEVALSASLSGYSSANAYVAGKSYGTFTNGYGIGLDGLPQATQNRVATLNPITIDPNKTYKVYSATNQKFIVGVLNNGTLVHRTANISSGATINTSGGTDLYVCMYNAQNLKVTVEDDKPFVFESSEVITTKTATLGRTVYGGTADFISGTGTITAKQVKFSDLTWTYQTSFGRFRCTTEASFIKKPANNYVVLDGLMSSVYPAGVAASAQADDPSIAVPASGEIYVYDSRYTDKDTWLAQVGNEVITYPLATAESFTFTPVPIDSFEGDNTLWADTGAVNECVYRGKGTAQVYPNAEDSSF